MAEDTWVTEVNFTLLIAAITSLKGYAPEKKMTIEKQALENVSQLRMVIFHWHVSFQEGRFLLYMYLDIVFGMNNVKPEM